jgi:N-acetylglucosaminyldiphosphoundecaprenol N-acetyl-beta-D-mannosaminyltransferase
LPHESTPRRAGVFGCPVDVLSLKSAIERADALIRAEQPARLGAINAAKLMSMEKDPVLAHAVSDCEMILADGVGVVWAALLLAGIRMRRVPGIDVMEGLVALAARQGYGVYFLGARQEVLSEMIRRLQARFPGLQVAGSHHGYFKREDEPALVASIRESGARILFVGMGTPAKELWIDRNFRATGVHLSMGVGGSFDVFAGHVKRAPGWLQRLGLEWFYRFLQEPRRMWRRYFVVSLRFLVRVVAHALRRPFLRDGAA